MDFWQYVAVFFMAMAFGISIMEVYQVHIQRKVITAIKDKLDTIDDMVDHVSDIAGKATTSAINSLQSALMDLLLPLRDKLLAIDLEALPPEISLAVSTAVKDFGAQIDVQAIIDAFSDTLVEKMQQAVPKMVHQAGGQITKDKEKFIKMAQENPVGTFLQLAMTQIERKQAAATAAPPPQESGIRIV